MADVALLRGGVPLIHCVTTWRPCGGLHEVTLSRLSGYADELQIRAAVRGSEASLPLGQPHHYSSSDVSLCRGLVRSWATLHCFR